MSRSHGFSQTKTDRAKEEERTKQRTESKQRQRRVFFFLHCRASTRHGRSTTGNSTEIKTKDRQTGRKERKTIGSGTGVDKKSKDAQCFHSNAVSTKLSPNASLFPVPSVLGCDVGASTHSSVCNPKSTKFFEFHTSGMKPPLQGAKRKMCENRDPKIRVFHLCPQVSRSHGFSQTKTDRTKKEAKTKQRTESKQRPKQRTDRKERKTIGSGTRVDKKSKEAQCFHSKAVFTKLAPNASLFPVPSVLGCDVGASTHNSVCNPKSTKFFEFHTSGMKPPL